MPTPISPRRPLRLGLRDNAEVVHHGLRSSLAPYSDRVQLVPSRVHADVVLVDPDALVPTSHPGTRLVLYPWHLRPDETTRALRNGFAGCIGKQVSSATLVRCVERIHRGEVVVRPHVRLEVPHRESTGPGPDLTPREELVLRLVAHGLSNEAIRREIGISGNTLKSYIRTSYRKIGVTSRSQAVLWGVAQGFVRAEGIGLVVHTTAEPA